MQKSKLFHHVKKNRNYARKAKNGACIISDNSPHPVAKPKNFGLHRIARLQLVKFFFSLKMQMSRSSTSAQIQRWTDLVSTSCWDHFGLGLTQNKLRKMHPFAPPVYSFFSSKKKRNRNWGFAVLIKWNWSALFHPNRVKLFYCTKNSLRCFSSRKDGIPQAEASPHDQELQPQHQDACKRECNGLERRDCCGQARMAALNHWPSGGLTLTKQPTLTLTILQRTTATQSRG